MVEPVSFKLTRWPVTPEKVKLMVEPLPIIPEALARLRVEFLDRLFTRRRSFQIGGQNRLRDGVGPGRFKLEMVQRSGGLSVKVICDVLRIRIPCQRKY
jgi:hypothetical protein